MSARMGTTIAGTAALVALAAAASGCKARTKEQVLQAEQEQARFETERKGRAVEGIGEGLQTAGKDGARALSKGVGDVFKGTVRGFDASLSTVAIRPGPGLVEAGLTVERAARRRADVPTVTAYLVSERAFAGALRLRAMSDGHEVGRSQTRVERQAGEAAYVDFTFDPRVPMATVTELELAVLPR
jgi:hypothetical protein